MQGWVPEHEDVVFWDVAAQQHEIDLGSVEVGPLASALVSEDELNLVLGRGAAARRVGGVVDVDANSARQRRMQLDHKLARSVSGVRDHSTAADRCEEPVVKLRFR